MLAIPRRFSHFVFGVIQSGLTCLVAAAVASLSAPTVGQFLRNWLLAWLVSWALMLPVVVLAAPLIRAMAQRLTRE